jgi:hypothetical protein
VDEQFNNKAVVRPRKGGSMMEPTNRRTMRIAAAGMFAGLVLAAAGPAAAAEYSLVIQFEDGCPDAVEDASESCGESSAADKACAKRNDKLVWTTNPEGKEFTLYFDPLKGGPKHESSGGSYSRHIDSDAPIATYKYTIVSPGCTPKDPRIVIRPD